MGLWWKKVSVEPPKEGCAVFEGDPQALPKKWWPILWRFRQDWALLQVACDGPYIFFFESEGTVMSYKTALNRKIVFVRIGPKPVRFWAVGVNGQLVGVSFTGQYIQAPLRNDKFSGHLPKELAQYYRKDHPFI